MILLLSVLICFIGKYTTAAPGRRIVGGTEVKNRSEFAFQVLLLHDGIPVCGGTIIDERHVLTAAHCSVDNDDDVIKARRVSVVVGSLNLYDRSNVKTVKNVFVHKNYNPSIIEDDIAMWRISGTFENTTDSIGPIDLQTKSITSGYCNVSGWGVTVSGSDHLSSTLLYVQIPVVPRSQCERSYNPLGANEICAGTTGKDSCQGDSGGPLVCSGLLTGIVSYGYDCAREGYPGVYTEVAKYLDWIEEQKLRASSTMKIVNSVVFFTCTIIISYFNFS